MEEQLHTIAIGSRLKRPGERIPHQRWTERIEHEDH
jgi:hypothetical protein